LGSLAIYNILFIYPQLSLGIAKHRGGYILVVLYMKLGMTPEFRIAHSDVCAFESTGLLFVFSQGKEHLLLL
jgi:hypothetical protein